MRLLEDSACRFQRLIAPRSSTGSGSTTRRTRLACALSGVLGGLSNFIERVLGRMVPYASSLLDELRPIVYVLRTTLTGIHLLDTGAARPTSRDSWARTDWRTPACWSSESAQVSACGLDPLLLAEWRPRVDELIVRLERAKEKSPCRKTR